MKIDTSIPFKNFRDIAAYNERIRPGLLYRSTALCLYQNEDNFLKKLEAFNIQTIIDLRADRELKETPYKKETLEKVNYVHAPFDPWNQPQWFKESYLYGTNEEIAYRFFGLGCKATFRKAILAILDHKQGSIVVHCHAGKDRTGIFICLLDLLSGANTDVVHKDYLASEEDTQSERLDIMLGIVVEQGGIIPYFESCGLTKEQINLLKQKLILHDD